MVLGSDTANFYDLRGKHALLRSDNRYGAERFPLNLRAPYQFYEDQLKSIEVAKGARFLDLCCGTGVHTILPSRLGYETHAVDLSPKSVQATEQLAREHQQEIQCHLSAAEDFLIGTNYEFDVIFLAESLYYLNLDVVLPLIARRLRPQGHLFLIETNGNNRLMSGYRRLRNRFQSRRDSQTLYQLLGPQVVERFRNEFERVELKPFDCLTLFGGALPRSMRSLYQGFARGIDEKVLRGRVGELFAFKFLIHAHIPLQRD